MAPIFGYWNARGFGQHIRMLLEYTGVEYKEKRYFLGRVPPYDKSEWLNEKFLLGLDFPNLPYYIDGDVKLTQSVAIIRYIANKTNMMGKSSDAPHMEMVLHQLIDMRNIYTTIVYSSDYDQIVGEYVSETLPNQLKLISKYLGDKNYLFGEITYLDFFLHEFIDIAECISPNCLDNFDNLKKLRASINSNGRIKRYMASDQYIKSPFNGPQARF